MWAMVMPANRPLELARRENEPDHKFIVGRHQYTVIHSPEHDIGQGAYHVVQGAGTKAAINTDPFWHVSSHRTHEAAVQGAHDAEAAHDHAFFKTTRLHPEGHYTYQDLHTGKYHWVPNEQTNAVPFGRAHHMPDKAQYESFVAGEGPPVHRDWSNIDMKHVRGHFSRGHDTREEARDEGAAAMNQHGGENHWVFRPRS